MNDTPRWRIELVNPRQPQQRAAVTRLRQQAYAGAAEFQWRDPATLAWCAADEQGLVLGLWAGRGSTEARPELLSTLRLSVFARPTQAERFLEHALAGVDMRWPALVLSRAATAPGQGRHGLMAMLRWAYLRALPESHVRSVLAVVYEDAPRLRSMQAVGYTLTVPTSSWDQEASALKTTLIAHLAERHFESARQAAQRLVASAIPSLQVPWVGLADGLLQRALQAAQPERETRPRVPELLDGV